MSEDKTEDTKSPLARRGARPFVGPAGGSAAARPFLRPAASPPRPGSAPFVPQGARPRPALGGPVPAPAPAPAQPVASAAHPPMRAATPVVVAAVPEIGESDPFFPVESHEAVDEQPASPRSITSEMVAIDAFDAFDAVWASAATRETPAAMPPVAAPPVDESSLGSLDAHDLWGEEITAADLVQTPPSDEATPAESTPITSAENLAAEPTVAPPSAPESAATRAALDMPAWLADDEPITDAVDETVTSPSDAVDVVPQDDSAAGVDHAVDRAMADSPAAERQDEYALSAWVDLPEPDVLDTPESSPAVSTVDAGSFEPTSHADAIDPIEANDRAPHAPMAMASSGPLETESPFETESTLEAAPESLGDALAALAESHRAVGPEPSPAVEERPRLELVEARGDDVPPEGRSIGQLSDQATLTPISARHVSIAFDRLAERVRRGEIDVSSIAPDATDAAILASVLAALLGGSSSR